MPVTAADLHYEDIELGAAFALERTFTQDDVRAFAEVSGDFSPLHIDEAYAASTEFGRCVVHGMLLGALCSQLVGMQIPGRRALYLGQELTFRRPVCVGETVRVMARVTAKNDATRVLVLQTEVRGSDDRVVASGYARVKVRGLPRQATQLPTLATESRAREVGRSAGVALVAGASRGIGAEIARVLAARGFRVAVNYWRSADAAASVVDDIRRAGGQAIAVQADVRDGAAVDALITDVTRQLGAPTVLVNGATGDLEPAPAAELPWARFESHLAYQVKSVLQLCQAVRPGMVAAGGGAIINLLSQVTGDAPPSQLADYVTAKYALLGLSKALAAEWASDNIRVNMVSPSLIRTELTQNYNERVFKLEAARTPLGSLATPRDAANAVAWFASDEARFLTGINMFVTGGQVMT